MQVHLLGSMLQFGVCCSNGVGKLLEPKGWIDNMLLCGRKGAHDIIRRTLTRWRLDIDGTLPEELRSRQVGSKPVLVILGIDNNGFLSIF